MDLDQLKEFYQRLDLSIQSLEKQHADRLHCTKGCSDCCMDGLTVYQVEAEYIKSNCAEVLRQKPHPHGSCAFLDMQKRCRIYPFRPYVCRTQGLPLRWLDLDENGNTVEYRDICPLNEEGISVELLPAEACWDIGPFEEQLANLQRFLFKGQMKRVALRSLFLLKDK